MERKVLTLCLVHSHPHILLGKKKRGFGEGWWNGFGGKVEEGESVEEAARREVREEAEIEVIEHERRGILLFDFASDDDDLEVHVFGTSEFYGSPRETEEMNPKWFHVEEIPFDDMWPDDKHWFPFFIEGKNFRGRFIFNEERDIVDYTLNEVESFDV